MTIRVPALAAATLFVTQTASAGATFDAIKARGTLVCGVNTGVAGFSAPDSRGDWSGIDVDLCKAIAAAVFLVTAPACRSRSRAFRTSESIFRAAVRAQPDAYYAHLKLAEVLRRKEDWNGAVHEYRLAIDATKPWGREAEFERKRIPGAATLDLDRYRGSGRK